MKKIRTRRILILMVRIGLFVLVLGLGTIVALVVDETPGLALADLPNVSVQTMATTTQGNVSYAVLTDASERSDIYRSVDNGRTWQATASWPNGGINTLSVHPTNEAILYAGTSGGPVGATNNVWRSDDGGQTWHNFNLSLPASPEGLVPAVTAVATDLNQPEVIYVGTDGQGVYRFREGQVGYELVGDVSLPALHVKALVVAPDSRLYGLTNQGLFTTTGDTWHKIVSLPGTPISLAVAPTNPQILYAGDPSSGVYASTDAGQTWQRTSDGLGLVPGAALRVTALVVDEQDPQHVVVATAYGLGSHLAPGGLFESYNGGHNWTKITDIGHIVIQLTFNNGTIYAATTHGLERYGKPIEPELVIPISGLRTLTNLDGTQILVLTLTMALGGLILMGRTEWVLGKARSRHNPKP